jgi:hypothetical protein
LQPFFINLFLKKDKQKTKKQTKVFRPNFQTGLLGVVAATTEKSCTQNQSIKRSNISQHKHRPQASRGKESRGRADLTPALCPFNFE